MTTRKNYMLGWGMWLIAASFYSLDYFQHTAPSVLIKPIADSLNVSIISVGNIMSIYFPIYAFSQLPAGYLLDRFGIKYVLTLACTTVSIGLFFMTSPSMSILIIGRALIAIGSAFAFIGTLKTASLWLPSSIFPAVVGLTNTIGVLGGILGQPFLDYLITRSGWQQATMYIAIFGILLAGVILLFLRTPRPKSNNLPLQTPITHIFSDKHIWILAIYAGVMVGTVVNAFSELYDVVFLQDTLRAISSEQASLISSMIFVGIAVGGPLHGIIANCFKYRRTWMIIACMGTIILFATITVSALIPFSISLMFLLYFLIGFFVSSMLLSFSLARCCYDQRMHGIIFALINMVIGVCGFLFQFGLGESIKYLSNYFGSYSHPVFFYSLLLLIVPLLLSLVLCFKIRKV